MDIGQPRRYPRKRFPCLQDLAIYIRWATGAVSLLEDYSSLYVFGYLRIMIIFAFHLASIVEKRRNG